MNNKPHESGNLNQIMSLIYEDSTNYVNYVNERVERCFKDFWRQFFSEDVEDGHKEKEGKVVVILSPHHDDKTLTIEYIGVPVAKILIQSDYSLDKGVSIPTVELKML